MSHSLHTRVCLVQGGLGVRKIHSPRGPIPSFFQEVQQSSLSTHRLFLRDLTKYSKSMVDLLRKGTYNSGQRPSGHNIGAKSFLSNNGGSIPPNVLVPAEQAEGLPLFEVLPISNTRATDDYQGYCRKNGILAHPARMQEKLAEFFVDFLTDEEDIILDPFAGSNTTGSVAQRLRRRWVSIELDPDYVAGAEARVRPESNVSTIVPRQPYLPV